jgi:hypothetical protein
MADKYCRVICRSADLVSGIRYDLQSTYVINTQLNPITSEYITISCRLMGSQYCISDASTNNTVQLLNSKLVTLSAAYFFMPFHSKKGKCHHIYDEKAQKVVNK